MLKTLVVVIVLAVGGWFAWQHFRPPVLDGREIPEDRRVTFVSVQGHVSIADYLDKDTWTLILFTAPGSSEGSDVERRLERAVGQRVKNVHLIIVDLGGLDSQAASELGLKKLPTAWLFDGIGKESDDLEDIVKLLKA